MRNNSNNIEKELKELRSEWNARDQQSMIENNLDYLKDFKSKNNPFKDKRYYGIEGKKITDENTNAANRSISVPIRQYLNNNPSQYNPQQQKDIFNSLSNAGRRQPSIWKSIRNFFGFQHGGPVNPKMPQFRQGGHISKTEQWRKHFS